MRLAIIGTGYVGLVTGTCLAEMGNDVTCIDVDAAKIEALQKGKVPIYEPGLGELIESNVNEGRLTFSCDTKSAVAESRIVMIAVGTPPSQDGSADLSAVFGAAREVSEVAPPGCVLVTKSTVPVGTAKKMMAMLKELGRSDMAVVSNPEFLKQGDAINDFLRPDRVVIGADSESAAQTMQELYAPFLRTGNRLILMDVASSEMTKYVANSFLATKISFMNEISRLCEKVGADVELVRFGISTDSRIGDKFLFPGLGFGGSCFPKDLRALIQSGQSVGCELDILRAVANVNEEQRTLFCHRLKNYYGSLKGKAFGMWGLAFKPRTDDTREAPALTVIDWLLEEGAQIRVFDPKAMAKVAQQYGDRLTYCPNAYEALAGVEAALIVTEWNEFRRPDFERMKSLMKSPVIFDGRNLFSPDRMRERGFEYFCIGR
ncbi:MAG: UDP-glucose/GDP-mannose dehydrogenase family protein [Candidatus Eremiobacteraeota bacterium]|nr:UDP-glucose/GDP-mannose dehydrogenase family protein [Candidatus Eremiobacteraeota bacterium]